MQNVKPLPLQARILDRGIITRDPNQISTKDVSFIYEIIDFIPSISYSKYLKNLFESQSLTDRDIRKAQVISDYLANIYNTSSKSDRPTYVKGICNFVQHTSEIFDNFKLNEGFCIRYTNEINIIRGALDDLLINSVKNDKVCLVHNDFHPNNILFYKNEFSTIDKFGYQFGEQAADIAVSTLFYIWYELRSDSKTKPFMTLYNNFMNNYISKTHNHRIFDILPVFYGTRALILAYQNEILDRDPQLSKSLLNIFCESIKDNAFSLEIVNSNIV